MITMTVNHVDIESYAIHRCLKTGGSGWNGIGTN